MAAAEQGAKRSSGQRASSVTVDPRPQVAMASTLRVELDQAEAVAERVANIASLP